MAEERKNKNYNLMIQGTMSGVGKSWLTAALCRILYQDGYQAAPFKSQNMALNSFITRDGLEMSRAQAVQAEAAGITPDPRMNPVLLKPVGDTGSEVIVLGKSRGIMKAAEYFQYRKNLIPEILDAYNSLAAEYESIMIEGAGSPVEMNLKRHDIVNMGLAERLDAPVILVGDIDRGGVFAQLYGTVELFTPSERKRVKGLIVNQFRGDPDLFKSGVKQLEDLTGIPVMGVIPYLNHVELDEEDSLAPILRRGNPSKHPDSENKNITRADGEEISQKTDRINIAIIRLPRIANFTDFAPLNQCPAVDLYYIDKITALDNPDMLILPDTGNMFSDCAWLKESGFMDAIFHAAARGVLILGVGGGYEILTREFGSESLRKYPEDFQNLFNHDLNLNNNNLQAGNLFGTRQRGLFDSAETVTRLLKWLYRRRKPDNIDNINININISAVRDAEAYRETQYNALADAVRASLDMDRIYEIIRNETGTISI